MRVPLPLWQLLMSFSRLWRLGPLVALRQRPAAMTRALAWCEWVLVPSQLMLGTFEALGFATTRFVVCPYGLDLQGLEPVPPRQPWLGPLQRPLRLGFIGSFNRAKGAHVLLEALQRLPSCWRIEVRIYGNPADDPAYAASLQQKAAPLPQVEWMGVFSSEEVFGVLGELDLLVVPSLWRENAPLIVLQALASGLPLLLSDVEGMADQVQPGTNALLFTPGDSAALAALLQHLYGNPGALAALSSRGGRPRSIVDYGDQVEWLYAHLQPK